MAPRVEGSKLAIANFLLLIFLQAELRVDEEDKKQRNKRRTSEPEPGSAILYTCVKKTGLHTHVEETGLLEGREKQSMAVKATAANQERRNMKKDKMVRRSQET